MRTINYFLLIILFCVSGTALANVALSKHRIYFDTGNRSDSLQLRNTGGNPATFSAELGMTAMTEEGEVYTVYDDQNSAIELIRYSPKRGELPPGGSQALRFAVRKPAGLADGEYRAVLKLTTAMSPTSGGNMTMSSNLAYSIPIIVRHGRVQAETTLENPQTILRDGNPHIQVWQTLTGNRSLFGNFIVTDENDNEVGVLNGVATYQPLTRRKVTIPLQGNVRGPVTIRYTESEQFGGKLSATVSHTIQ